MSAPILDPPLGTIVQVSNVGRGVVRFSGPTDFKPGKWIGIELEEQRGKNDGSVAGVKYFNCKNGMGYGVFVRPGQIKKVLGNERPQPAPPPAKVPTPRPGLGHQRTNSNSLRASPGTSSSSRSASPAKPQATAPKLVSSPPARLGQPSPSKKTSLHQSRRSISLKQPPALDRPASPNVPRVSSPLVSSPLGQTADSPKPEPKPALVVEDNHDPVQALQAKIRVLENKRAADALHIRGLESRLSEAEAFVSLRPKLQAKLQQQQTELIDLKRQLTETTQLAKVNEERAVEREEQLELAMLDKEMADEKREMCEGELEDLKERLAIAEVELEVLREEAEVEKQGPLASTEESSKEITTSLPYIQLEKQNERLKEALLRLRDMTQETDVEQKQRIGEMERDLEGFDELRQEYELTKTKLSTAESQIEHLKVQLDDALGAEDMLVTLTERNLVLGEKIEEMRITIEDLEALKELSDELEENHVETEKALTEDIGSLQTQLAASQVRNATLSDACSDYEGTIGQFRELVERLQSELSSLRLSTATAESTSASALSQTAAILSANIKLQSTASKNQARMMELEIKRLEARELREELAVLEMYLPAVYNEQSTVDLAALEGGTPAGVPGQGGEGSGARGDRDALKAYMFFQRIGWKADIINAIIAQTHGLPESLDSNEGGISEQLVGICEMRGRLSGLSTLCKRFAAVLRRAEPEMWLGIGRLYREIAPLEKRLDIHVDLLRRDEFRERECVSDVVKIQSQFNHLAEIYFAEYFSASYSGYAYDIGERQLGSIVLFDLDLDMFAASIGMMKTSVEGLLKEDEFASEADYGGFDIHNELYEPLQKLLERAKSAKQMSKKMAKRLEELTDPTNGNPSALKAELLVQMESCGNLVGELVNFGISLAQQTLLHLVDVRAAKISFKLTNILGFAKQQAAQITSSTAFKPGTLWYEAVGSVITQLLSESGKLLPLTMTPENVIKITGPHPHPWVARVPEIQRISTINAEAERRIASLSDEVQSLVRTLRTKDQAMQELNVKVELMERRGEQAKKQSEVILGLEGELGKARKQEKAYEEAMEQLQADLDMLEKENGRLKSVVSSIGVAGAGVGAEVKGAGHVGVSEGEGGMPGVGGGIGGMQVEGGSLDQAQLFDQYHALRSTLRFLRMENAYLKGHDLLQEIQALPAIPDYNPQRSRIVTPPLDPSGLSDTDMESDEDENDKSDEEDEEEGSEETKQEGQNRKGSTSHSTELSFPAERLSSMTLATEVKILYRSVIRYSSSPRVVDLSETNKRRLEASLKCGLGQARQRQEEVQNERNDVARSGTWIPRKKMPVQQVLDRKLRGEKLSMKVRGLMERVERASIIRGA
ncbi:hypothetical protein GYMLUDRAFT_40972 [Collybiopsis luxurians FD-317 M1]|uniref:CAP-Gly domain-containing protein n=1 Tax=Collybiopsis luxurians FD-317 M1 TaxID=944289 RepID=A0A0D0BIG6_9AGAR|nr:hypothetical protein GYMLUDRAFT_40972 [Collybiopsis luxurians FD-317 M1]